MQRKQKKSIDSERTFTLEEKRKAIKLINSLSKKEIERFASKNPILLAQLIIEMYLNQKKG